MWRLKVKMSKLKLILELYIKLYFALNLKKNLKKNFYIIFIYMEDTFKENFCALIVQDILFP